MQGICADDFSAARVGESQVGLLEELEREAQERGIERDGGARRKSAHDATYRSQLEPALDQLHAFLGELIEKVRSLKPRAALRYHVPGYGDIAGYIEHEYRLDDARMPSSREITLDYACLIASDECPSVEIEGVSRVRAVSGFFQRHRIGGMLGPRKDASGELVAATFRAKGRIALSAKFHADAESAQLRMTFVNFDGFGTTTRPVPAAQVDARLFDEIGRFLLREPNALLREDLPEAYRRELKSKVQQLEMKRRWEIRIGDAREAELAALRRQHTASGRLSGMFEGLRNAATFGGAFGKLRALVERRR
jgi:hypothetical protein